MSMFLEGVCWFYYYQILLSLLSFPFFRITEGNNNGRQHSFSTSDFVCVNFYFYFLKFLFFLFFLPLFAIITCCCVLVMLALPMTLPLTAFFWALRADWLSCLALACKALHFLSVSSSPSLLLPPLSGDLDFTHCYFFL